MADRQQRAIAKAQFTRAENQVKRDLEADEAVIPITTVERHRQALLGKWQRVQDIQTPT